MTKISDTFMYDGVRDFRLMNRKFLLAFLSLDERNRFSKGIVSFVGFKVKWFEYENIMRPAGKTTWSIGHLFSYAINGIIAFSSKPLILASILGVFMFIAATIWILYIVIRHLLFGYYIPYQTASVCVLLMSSGLIMLSLGIIGLYLGKIYDEVKKRPHYIVRDESEC
jgi:hypothetical protein